MNRAEFCRIATRWGAALWLATAMPLAGAATCTWLGAGADPLWSTPGNWDVCGATHDVPADGDSLVFPLAAVQRTSQNDLAGLDLAQIQFSGPSYVVTGNAITLSSGIVANVPLGGSNDTDPSFAPSIALAGSAPTLQCTGTRGLALTGALDLVGFPLIVIANCAIALQGNTSGAGSLTKAGTGTLILSGSNTYTGSTTVNQGTLLVASSGALGATGAGGGSGTVVADGAQLQLEGNIVVADEPLTLNGNGIAGNGAMRNVSGNNTYTGTILLATDTSVGVSSNGNLQITQVMSGSSGLTKVGAGTMQLSGSNTYGGLTNVNEGTLIVASNTALGSSAVGTTVTSGAALALNGSLTISNESLTLNGNGVGGTGALRNLSGSTTWAGPITLGGTTAVHGEQQTITVLGSGCCSVGGSGGLTKLGLGTVVLPNASNSYTGLTVINQGILQIAGSMGDIILNSGGTLAPLGPLNAGTLTWNGGGGVALRIGPTSGPSDDRLQLSGVLAKGSGAGFTFHFSDAPSGAPATGSNLIAGNYIGTNFLGTDFEYTYAGEPSSVLAGEFIVGPTQLQFHVIAISLFTDGFEDP